MTRATVARLPNWGVVAAYVAAACVFARPLIPHLTSSIAADYGDSLFTAWVMTWVARHLLALAGGDLSAWAAMWDTPIFMPERNTLAYSEHFLGQTLQVLPLYGLTEQPLLAFNLVFLATFALTGLAAHRLAYTFTGSHVGGVVAGLTCMFSEYRVIWSSHLHMLSVHWWLFALLGIDRYTATRSRWALAGTMAALTMLHLSSNYLMAFTAPLTAAFAVWALARHGRLRDGRAWLALTGAGASSVIVVLPIVLRYLSTRADLGVERSLTEIAANSATLDTYRLAWPWLAPLAALAALGVAAPAGARLMVTRRARLGLLALTAAAVMLSFGPILHVGGVTWPGPYRLLVDYVPGFTGLRVVERYFVIALALGSVLAGIGAAWLSRWRVGLVVALLLASLAVRPAFATPFMMNREIGTTGLPPQPAYLRPSTTPPAIYRFVRTLPPDAVIAELPFAVLGYEILYTYFTLGHGHRTINGYSGVLPPSYLARAAVLQAPLADPETAWRALAPATHVIVHPYAWHDDTGARIRAWLESHGAQLVIEADHAWLLALPDRRLK